MLKIELFKKNSYTVEQLIDPEFKNIEGESNKDVRNRMEECISSILYKNEGKRIAVVSHGAAIKFLMQKWCEYSYERDIFLLNGIEVFKQQLETPAVIKLVFEDNTLQEIKMI